MGFFCCYIIDIFEKRKEKKETTQAQVEFMAIKGGVSDST